MKLQLALSFDDVLLKPQYSTIKSRSRVNLTTKLSPNLTLKIPLIATKMDTVTGVKMAIAMSRLGGMAIIPRFDAPQIQANKIAKIAKAKAIAAAAVGAKSGYLKRAEILVKAGATVLNTDVAHGHMQTNLDAIKQLKNKFKNKITLIGGIAATAQAAADMYKNGADIVSCGVGGGSICTTRVQTGCGVPTMQTLLDIQKVALKHKKTYIPEAGIRNSGDIVKSLAAGAGAVMAGSIFAGTAETPGRVINIEGQKYKIYSGSTSLQQKQEQVKKYKNGKNDNYSLHIEGVKGLVKYKGPLKSQVDLLLAGIKSGFSYCGAKNIKQLHQKAQFIQITNAGITENNAHDVITHLNN